MSYRVYKITNIQNGKAYVGVTKRSLAARWRAHLSDAFVKLSPCYFHNALRKYGEDSWRLEELCSTEKVEDALMLEMKQIAAHGTFGPRGYNSTLGGRGAFGAKRSPEHIAKLRTAHVGQKRSAETRRRISEAARNRPINHAHMRRLHEAAKGKSRPRDVIEKMLRTKAANPYSPSEATRLKQSAAMKGRRHPQSVVDLVTKKITGENSKLAKDYRVTFPDGRIEIVRGLSDFCRKHNLTRFEARRAARTVGVTHRGFSLEELGYTGPVGATRPKGHKFTQEERIEIARLYNSEEHTASQIALRFDTHASTVRQIAKRLSVGP